MLCKESCDIFSGMVMVAVLGAKGRKNSVLIIMIVSRQIAINHFKRLELEFAEEVCCFPFFVCFDVETLFIATAKL